MEDKGWRKYDVNGVFDKAKAIVDDESMSLAQKRKAAQPYAPEMRRLMPLMQADLKETQQQIASNARFVKALEDMEKAWGLESTERGFNAANLVLQRNDCSRLHKLGAAIEKRDVVAVPDDRGLDALPPDIATFVISHDWAAIVQDEGGEVKLPYESCSFEYRFSGRTLLVMALQAEGETLKAGAFYESANDAWVYLGEATEWLKHVRAACIVLEAEVATAQIQRAPHKLNEKRIKAGKLPLYSFHTVNLAKRHRVAASATQSGEPAHRKRLHFCRGHWRHFEKSKTWIKWCLKGSPDLGFVGKEYRL